MNAALDLARRFWWVLALPVALAAAFAFGHARGASVARAKADAERVAANVIATITARSADEVAAVERVDTALALAQKKDDLTDAIASTPDVAPDAVRVRLGCERLRQAGTRAADIPAVCGRAGGDGGEAAARP